MRPPPKITDARGRSYTLVPVDRVLVLDRDHAERMLRDSIADDGGSALRALARDHGLEELEPEESLSMLARAIERGELVAIEIEDELDRGAPASLGNDPVDWDNIPSLGELVVPRGDDGPRLDPARPVEPRHAVTEVVLDGYAQGAAVMRWGGMRARTDGTVATARAALRLALWNGRGKLVAVAGHADPLGQDTDNDALSRERAKSVQLFASGQLDAWAEHALAHASDLDLACALVACHRILGLGPAGIDDAPKLDAALVAMRRGAGRAVDGPVGLEDWVAFGELYEVDLAALMMTDRAGLAEIRGSVSWIDPPVVAMGETQPVELVERVDVVGPVALAHRRCSLLVFGAADEGPAAVGAGGHAVYDGTYLRTTLRVPGEVLVDIVVATPARQAIPGGRAWISCGALGAREHLASDDGHIRFTALLGDEIDVVAACNASGRGALLPDIPPIESQT
jgi:hypothetical protein